MYLNIHRYAHPAIITRIYPAMSSAVNRLNTARCLMNATTLELSAPSYSSNDPRVQSTSNILRDAMTSNGLSLLIGLDGAYPNWRCAPTVVLPHSSFEIPPIRCTMFPPLFQLYIVMASRLLMQARLNAGLVTVPVAPLAATPSIHAYAQTIMQEATVAAKLPVLNRMVQIADAIIYEATHNADNANGNIAPDERLNELAMLFAAYNVLQQSDHIIREVYMIATFILSVILAIYDFTLHTSRQTSANAPLIWYMPMRGILSWTSAASTLQRQ